MAQNDAMSRFADKHFDGTYNLSLIENDLPNVKFGRVDYLNVTYLTTKWAVWSCVSLPFFLVCLGNAYADLSHAALHISSLPRIAARRSASIARRSCGSSPRRCTASS